MFRNRDIAERLVITQKTVANGSLDYWPEPAWRGAAFFTLCAC